MRFVLGLLLLLFVGAVHSKGCNKKLDIAIFLDLHSKLDPRFRSGVRAALSRVIGEFDGDVRFAFESSGLLHPDFEFKDGKTKTEVQTLITGLKTAIGDHGSDHALFKLKEYVLWEDAGDRADAPNVVIIFTDTRNQHDYAKKTIESMMRQLRKRADFIDVVKVYPYPHRDFIHGDANHDYRKLEDSGESLLPSKVSEAVCNAVARKTDD